MKSLWIYFVEMRECLAVSPEAAMQIPKEFPLHPGGKSSNNSQNNSLFWYVSDCSEFSGPGANTGVRLHQFGYLPAIVLTKSTARNG